MNQIDREREKQARRCRVETAMSMNLLGCDPVSEDTMVYFKKYMECELEYEDLYEILINKAKEMGGEKEPIRFTDEELEKLAAYLFVLAEEQNKKISPGLADRIRKVCKEKEYSEEDVLELKKEFHFLFGKENSIE